MTDMQDNNDSELQSNLTRDVKGDVQNDSFSLFEFLNVKKLGLFLFIWLFVYSIGWNWHLDESNIISEVESDSLSFTLREPWIFEETLEANSLAINNLAVISDSALISTQKIDGEETIEVELASNEKTGAIFLERLEIPAKATVEIHFQNDILQVFIRGVVVNGVIGGENAKFLLAYQEEEEEFKIEESDPDFLTFESASTKSEPVRLELRFKKEQSLRLRGLKIGNLSFLEEYPPDSGMFESVIRKGRVSIYESQDKSTLEDGEVLNLEGIQQGRLELRKGKKEAGLTSLFKGVAQKIELGPQGLSIDKRPNLLQYFFHHQQMGLFWGGFGFLFALLGYFKEFSPR